MTRSALVLAAAVLLAGCSGTSSDAIPGGTWAGSTADDREFVIEVGEDLEVNRREARYVDRGVLEVEAGAARMTVQCELLENEEELRCDVSTKVPGQPDTTEVIDLMLL